MSNPIAPVQPETLTVKRWKRGDPHPEKEGIVFHSYRKGGIERWCSAERLVEINIRAAEKSREKRKMFPEKYAEVAARQAAKIRANPEKHALVKQKMRDYWQQIKQDESRLEEDRRKNREKQARYKKLREQDPEKMAAWLAKKQRDKEVRQEKRDAKRVIRAAEVAERKRVAAAYKNSPEGKAAQAEYQREYRARKAVEESWRDARREAHRNWVAGVKQDPEKYAAYMTRITTRMSERRQTEPLYATKQSVSGLLRTCFKRKGFRKNSRTADILGCSIEQFKQHVERLFLPGMCFEKKQGMWHLDHIVPVSLARTEEEIAWLSRWENIRPMWGLENILKRDNPPTMEECPEYLRDWLRDRLAESK